MLSNLKKNLRKSVEDELERTTSLLDSTVKFRGIIFQKNPQNDGFRKREEYPFINLLTQ